MIRLTFLLSLLASPFWLAAQPSTPATDPLAAVRQLFDGMRASDSARVRAVFHPDMRLQSVSIGQDGKPRLTPADKERFLQSVGAPKKERYDERIWTYDIRIDGNLATVWTDYSFFVGETFSHCGVNAFHLFKGESGWQITQITDTRRKEGCLTEAPDINSTLNGLIDQWHRAAATADEDAFFGAMAPDGVYIGTDAGERWDRDTFRAWAQKAFDREVAWAFQPRDRHLMRSADGRTAWWDELLDTWMGVCRASGVLELRPEGWKITHYQLSLAVPNEKMDKVKKVISPR